jgi:hypothetical protein
MAERAVADGDAGCTLMNAGRSVARRPSGANHGKLRMLARPRYGHSTIGGRHHTASCAEGAVPFVF